MTLRAYRAGANAAYDAIDSRRTNAATIMSRIKRNPFWLWSTAKHCTDYEKQR